MNDFDHDPYNPLPAFTATIASGQIIEIEKFITNVKNSCFGYLQHSSHHGELNAKVGNYDIWNYPVPSDSGSASTGIEKRWTTTVADITNTINDYSNSFRTANQLKIIDANKTWEYITKCFYETCRIGELRFSFYQTAKSTSATEKYSIGLLDNYYSTYSSYVSAIEKIRPDSLKANKYIIAIDVSTLLYDLMKFNADCELIYDHGCRNERHSYSYPQWYSTYRSGDNESGHYSRWEPYYQSLGYTKFNVFHMHINVLTFAEYLKNTYNTELKSNTEYHGNKYYAGNMWGNEDYGNQFVLTEEKSANELIPSNPSMTTKKLHKEG